MAYDIHGPWDGVTGHNAPLNPSSRDVNPYLNIVRILNCLLIEIYFMKQYNFVQKACVNSWIRHGADPAKLVLGMPTYGKSFTLANPANNGVGVPSIGEGGEGGPYTKQTGMLGYNEVHLFK